jgi:hypothetical protein
VFDIFPSKGQYVTYFSVLTSHRPEISRNGLRYEMDKGKEERVYGHKKGIISV